MKTGGKLKMTQAVRDKRLVNEANNQVDLLSLVPSSSHIFENGSMHAVLECKRRADVDAGTLQWAFQLLRNNMQLLYTKSEWGWNSTVKKRELMDEDARYLIAREDRSGKPLAFCHFRFDMDHGFPVLYCYEIQLEKKCRRKGLGRFMLNVLEELASSSKMSKVVLTVLKNNPDSISFFHSLKYEVDETSPGDDSSYQILSKPIKA